MKYLLLAVQSGNFPTTANQPQVAITELIHRSFDGDNGFIIGGVDEVVAVDAEADALCPHLTPVTEIKFDFVASVFEIADDAVALVSTDHKGVSSAATLQGVVVISAKQAVITRASIEAVLTPLAVEDVIALAAIEGVITISAIKDRTDGLDQAAL